MIETPKGSYKVVKSFIFGPIFLQHTDYTKLVTLKTCWMQQKCVIARNMGPNIFLTDFISKNL